MIFSQIISVINDFNSIIKSIIIKKFLYLFDIMYYSIILIFCFSQLTFILVNHKFVKKNTIKLIFPKIEYHNYNFGSLLLIVRVSKMQF